MTTEAIAHSRFRAKLAISREELQTEAFRG